MPDFSLIKFEGKPIEKLIDVVSKGIGDWRRPKQIRKEADAEAYKIKVISKANTEAALERKQAEFEFERRIENRLSSQEIRRQQSIDNVINEAAKQIQNHDVNDDPVSPDWAIQFFNFAQDITDQDMQVLWAKVLAGETMKPKSFSLRTLDTLKKLHKDEAEILIKVRPFVLGSETQRFIFNYGSTSNLNDFGVSYDDLFVLDEIGLLSISPIRLGFDLTHRANKGQFIITAGNIGLLFELTQDQRIQLDVFSLTKVGAELSSLVNVAPNIPYLKQFKRKTSSKTVNVELIRIKEMDKKGNVLSYELLDDI